MFHRFLTHSFTLLFSTTILLTSAIAPPATKIAVTHGNIQSFNNAERGAKITGISQFKRYLSRFGYLPINHNNTFSDEFDALFESALIRYQRKLGLQVTGRLDSDTISQMITPRCGVPDITESHPNGYNNNNLTRPTQHFVYFPGKPRWSRAMPMTLTYAFSREYVIHTLSVKDIREVFKRAFTRWASVIPVSFIESEDYDFADIRIGFYSGEHGDGEAFDGALGVLAHSFSPEIGRMHLDAAETWAVDFGATESVVAVDLESVATHEIGHLLGLSHSSVREAVMYPSLRPRDKRADLSVDDVKGVQSLYGSNRNFRSEWALESVMSANHGAQFGGKDFKLVTALIVVMSSIILSFCTCS